MRLLMATRRTDQRARDSWLRLALTIRRLDHVTGVLIDRTPNGEAELYLQDLAAGIISDGSLHIVRQTYDAPMSDVLRLWSSLSPKWTVGLHDDDTWIGDPVVPHSIDPRVTLYAPKLLISDTGTGRTTLARPWTSQHALFGAVSPRLQSAYLKYVGNSPMTIGGEDLLLLFMAAEMGQLRWNPDFTYRWESANWSDAMCREVAVTGYTQGFLEDHVDATTAFILFQSLDRLACCTSMRPYVSETVHRRAVRNALRSFWPVVDHRGKFIYRMSTRRIRVAMLSTRGVAPRRRRITGTIRALQDYESLSASNWFMQVTSGAVRLVSLRDIRKELIPRIRASVAPDPLYMSQVEYWEGQIGAIPPM